MQALTLECQDDDCIGCDLCVRFCPVVALELQSKDAAVAASSAS